MYRQKYLREIAMKFCTVIHDPQKMNLTNFSDLLTSSSNSSWLTLVVLRETIIGWIALNFGTYDFDDPLTYHLAPTSDQSFHLSSILVYND